mgnify:CR=1 FL=1
MVSALQTITRGAQSFDEKEETPAKDAGNNSESLRQIWRRSWSNRSTLIRCNLIKCHSLRVVAIEKFSEDQR